MEQIKPQILLPFSNPVLAYSFPYNDNFRTSLIQECFEYRNQTESINSSYAHRQVGWQSPQILFTTKKPCLKKIAELVLDSVGSISKFIAPNIDLNDFKMNGSGWININQKGSLHFPHTHQGSIFSGVFYVKVPIINKQDTTDINKPGFIEFIDPRNDVTSFARFVPEFEESLAFKQQMLIEPKEGVLLVFPAWLKHWVYPNTSNEERISISFNMRLITKKKVVIV